MSHDFESVFAAMADRAIRRASLPPSVAVVSESERMLFLAEWCRTRACARAWAIEDTAVLKWCQHRRAIIKTRVTGKGRGRKRFWRLRDPNDAM